MSEPEGYVDTAKENLMPKEYVVELLYRLFFDDRLEPPSESEIRALIKEKCETKGFLKNSFDIFRIEDL